MSTAALSIDISYVTAFMVGLLGGVHCVGMCGGIVGALTMGVAPPNKVRSSASLWPYLLAYNSGRISSYVVAGALMGGFSWLSIHLIDIHRLQLWLQLLAGLFMIALGLYIAGWWRGLTRIEQLGGRLWKVIEPVGRRFLPVTSIPHAFFLGLIWGWLPCGLVYSVLIWSIASGSPFNGGLLMLSFGLGTLPALLAMGVFAAALSRLVRHKWIKWLAGCVILGFAAITIFRALQIH